MQDEQPKGFINRGINGLLILFTIPALLTVGAMFVVIWMGRIPGGNETICEQNLNDSLTARLTIYAYQAGLSLFETQTIAVNQNGTWQELASDTVQWPQGISCENNIIELGTGVFLLYNEKSLALSDNNGETWQVYNVCDEPRPVSGRCDADPLALHNINIDESGAGQFTVRQSITDEYGQPLYENGLPRLAGEWTITTSDAGRNWRLQSTD